jgi:gluconate 2-dehydrogenase gamma chain
VEKSVNRKERPLVHSNEPLFIELSDELISLNKEKMTRREFLLYTGLFSVTCILPVLHAEEANIVFSSPYKQDPWLTINIVQQHLFPSELKSPGANEINATNYLKNLLTENFLNDDEKEFILKGPGWLNDLSKSKYKKTFARLSHSEQNVLLRQIVKSTAGENWLATLLSYIFEALLAAPIYGGNPKGVGWSWLGHQPGFPLPDKNSLTWQELQKR